MHDAFVIINLRAESLRLYIFIVRDTMLPKKK